MHKKHIIPVHSVKETLLGHKFASLLPFILGGALLLVLWLAFATTRLATAQEDNPPSLSAIDNGRDTATSDTPAPVTTASAAHSSKAVNTTLTGYWPFDDETNPTADASGNGHAGTLMGDPVFTTTVPTLLGNGTALDFDGAGDYVAIGGNEADFDLNIMSIALWLKVDNFTTAYQAILTKGDNSWRIHRSEMTNFIEFATTSGGTTQSLLASVDMLDGNWHHVVAVYDGAQKLLYVDGVLDNFVNYTNIIDTNDYPVLIGDNGEINGRYFDGQIDDVRIYSEALSATDVAQLYGGQFDRCFIETTGDNLTDYVSDDASALQMAVSNANPGDTLKVAGTCAGVQTFGGNSQTTYITQSLTLQGGYTTTNWLAASDPDTYPTMLDAQGGGRVVYINTGLNVTLDGLTLTGGLSGNGGGLFLTASTLTVTHSILTANSTTGDGGAIFTEDNCTLAIFNSTLSTNTATSDGGGIFGNDFCTITIDSSTLSGNTATNDYGGGIFMDNNSDLIALNSTFSDNSANDGGGAFADDVGVMSVFSYTTIVSNTAVNGGGGLDMWGSTAQFSGSVLAYNVRGAIANNIVTGNGAVITSQGYNLEDRNDAGFTGTGDLTNTDPLLDVLADNGGDTQTHALVFGSPAIDQIPAGTNGCGTAVATDQRGYIRPFDTNCDMGAFEYLPALLVAFNDAYTTTEDMPLAIAPPGILANDYYAHGAGHTTTLQTAPTNGAVTLNLDGSFIYTPTQDFNGTDSFAYFVSDGPTAVQAYWPFEDGSNPTADVSGHNNDGTLVNGPVFTTTTPVTLTGSNLALDFDGVNDGVNVPGPITLANQSFTVAFWAKRNALSGNTDIVFGQGTGTTNVVLHIGFRNSNVFTCAFWNNDLNTPTAYTDLDWHHWACTYDAATNERAIYRDGVLVASDIASADYQGSGTVWLGNRNNGDHFDGLLDDVQLYYNSLSPTEVQAAMVGEAPALADIATVTLNVTPVNDPPTAVDDSYTTPQGTPFFAHSIVDELTTIFASNNGQSGNMFDVTAGAADISITSFDANIAAGAETVEVYYKVGSYVGSEQLPGDWTFLGTANVVGQGQDNPTPVPIGGLTIPAGQTYGLYFTLSTGTQINYTNGANVYSSSHLTITTGTGNGYPFASVNTPRTWNGTIYYTVGENVLANDTDIDGDPLATSLSTSPDNGTLTFNGDGTFIYTPTISFVGVDTFNYIASDGTLTDTTTVSITVTAVPCLVETTGDNLTDYASADESALQTAVNNASPGDLLKVAGTCTGTHLQGGQTQTVYISQTLTIQGGYTYTNWLATPDPVANPTVLDALGTGRVVYIPAGYEVTLDGLTLTAGDIAGDGGGVYNAGNLLIQQTAVHTNTATASGGGIYSSGILTMTNSMVTDNAADSGSGIYNTNTLTVIDSTFTGNASSNDGTVTNYGGASIQASSFYTNTAFRGGGIYADGSNDLLVANSTFAYNSATEGGGIHNRGTMTVTNSTFAHNTATGGGAVHNWNGGMSLYNNILANNGGGSDECLNNGTLNASVNNLITDGSCSATITADPLLAPFADNGGPTWTFMLQAGSPAIDAGDDATCEAADQRGIARPQGLHCDIGAVEIEQEVLSVLVTGTGSGSISSNPVGIECGITCTAAFYPSTVVTLTVSADTGSTFASWSGDCTGTGDCVVTMDMAHNVTATFTLDQHDLTVALDGTGSGSVSSNPAGIDCEPDCAETYDYGTAITLTAAADSGSTFTGWAGDCTGTGDCVVTMDAAKNVTATFTLGTNALTVVLAGTGSGTVTSDPAGIACGATCVAVFDYGTVVTLTASADLGSTFIGWSGPCTGTGGCAVTMDAAQDVTATFTLNQYELSVTVDGSGTVTSEPAGIDCGSDCAQSYDYGTVVTLTAVTDANATFTGWSGACSGTGVCVITMDMAQTVTATFSEVEQTGYFIYLPMVTKP